MPFVSVASGGRADEGGAVSFNVSLSSPSSQTVSVEWFTGIDTAASGDFYLSSGTLNFASGEVTKTVIVNFQYDSEEESDEFFYLELANPVGATFANGVTARASAVILDNDGAGSDLAIHVSDGFLLEGNAGLRDAVFDVTLSRPATSSTSFSFRTFDITATAGSDYAATTGTLTFLPGQDVVQVRVPVYDDGAFEAAETFGLLVSPPNGLPVNLSGAAGTGYIIDDDAGGLPSVSIAALGPDFEGSSREFIVRLSTASANSVTVSYRPVAGTASTSDYNTYAPQILTFKPGQTELRVLINTSYDSLAEIDESVFLELFNPKGAVLAGDGGVLRADTFILDNDGGGSDLAVDVSAAPIVEGDFGSQDATFVVRLSRPQLTTVTLDYQTANGTALAGQDYGARSGSISFAPGQDVAIVKVPVLGDAIKEDAETFILSVSGIVNGANVVASGSATVLANDASAVRTALVDDAFYNATYNDIRISGTDADQHYFSFGAREGRDPNAFFSTNGYLGSNQDVKAAGLNPLQHYDQYGWRDGRDPSANFDTTLYLQHNADVKAAGIDPLAHFLQYGQAEGRQAYAAIGPASSFNHGSFDAEFYLLSNPDVAKAVPAGVSANDFAFNHYQAYGWHEGRNPNAFFDVKGYLNAYADVKAANIDPLGHYDTFGWKDGRDPSGAFDTKNYVSHNVDVAAAQIDPLLHYLQYGAYENRATYADGTFFHV